MLDFSIEFIEDDLKSTLNKFFNEIELSFDYVSKETIHKLKCFFKKIENGKNIYDFAKTTCPVLKKYEDNIAYIVTGKTKFKTSDFEFLKELVLFDDILEFKIFINENKNTKKTIINYINNIYMAICILEFGLEKTSKNFSEIYINDLINKKNKESIINVEKDDIKNYNIKNHDIKNNDIQNLNMNNILNSFTKNIDLSNFGIENIDFNNLQNISFDNLDNISNNISSQFNDTLNGIDNFQDSVKILQDMLDKKEYKGDEGVEGDKKDKGNNIGINNLGDVFKSLMANKEIMNIASDMTNEIQIENIDPISLLTSLMSGKKDDKLLGIVHNITSKLEEKINTGKIDKNMLEKEAENILNKFKNPKEESID
jgi:hypothetical protein